MCLCTSKVKASGQETGLDSNLASLTSIFKLVLAGLINPSFNKSCMRLFSMKPKKKLYIFVASFSHKKENKSYG